MCTGAGGLAWPPTPEKPHKLLRSSSENLHTSKTYGLVSPLQGVQRSTIAASYLLVSITGVPELYYVLSW